MLTTDVGEFLAKAIEALGPQVVAIVALIAADLVLALGAAIKTKMFKMEQVAAFLQTQVIPKLFGWLGAAIIGKFVLPEYLDGVFAVGAGAMADLAFVAVVVSLAGSIVGHMQTIGIIPASADGALRKVGIEY